MQRSFIPTTENRLSLHSGAPFWLLRNGLPPEEQPLTGSTSADVAIVGGGITGALVADSLAASGADVILIDARIPGSGSTAASTALIQYEIDFSLRELAQSMGEPRAVHAYRCAVSAVDGLARLCAELGDTSMFSLRGSLFLGSRRRDRAQLAEEVALRQRYGIPAEFWDARRVEERYGFASYGAIHTTHAADMDPLRLTSALLARARANGVRVAGRTRIDQLHATPSGVTLTTTDGATVRARTVVIATGYEAPLDIVRQYVSLNSTYAFVTEPMDAMGKWNDGTLVWESKRPYTYLRMTPDHRIMCGGDDVPFEAEQPRDMLLPIKTRRLERRLQTMLPDIAFEVAHAWTGTFAETKDGLPYIGAHPELPGVLFALGYGGNGITFSYVAAELIGALVRGEKPPEAELFGFER